MTQLFGIDRGKLKSKYNNLMRLSTDAIVGTEFEIQALAVRNVIDSLVPIESEKHEYKKAKKGSFECICGDVLSSDKHFPIKKSYSIDDVDIPAEKKEECIYCDKSIPRNNKPGGINQVCEKHLREQPKEERCTKCNGEGYEVGYDDTIVCPHCNGTGKEPRKEECQKWIDTCNALNDKVLAQEAKLSRYKEALEKILEFSKEGSIYKAYNRMRLEAEIALAEDEKGRNSIKQEARVNLIKMVQTFINRKTGDWSHIMVWIEKYIDRAYSQGVADERKRAAGVAREWKVSKMQTLGTKGAIPEAIASEIERGEL